MLTELAFFCLLLITVALAVTLWGVLKNVAESGSRHVTVVVIGDIGRSPRMQYHALSFARRGYYVDVVGYNGATPHKDILNNKNVSFFYLQELPSSVTRFLPKILAYAFKCIWQALILLYYLLKTSKASHLLIQTPPAIPTMAVAWLFCMYRDTRFIIDWHNYGYTLLALSLSTTHPLVRLAKWYEPWFGRKAAWNFCVTHALKSDLKTKWGISADTLYDRPPAIFKRADLESSHRLFCALATDYPEFAADRQMPTSVAASAFTENLSADGTVRLRPDRPALLVSSTSWTEDEDFSLLLTALEYYDKKVEQTRANLPDLVCAVTGKGPLKAHYQELISRKHLKHVRICTPWLVAEDYPVLLGSADLGVCLHISSSGLDLPMKVVDMFGCGLPVCAVSYNCLDELVQDGKNGLHFSNAVQLCEQLQELLTGFPSTSGKLLQFRENLTAFQNCRWEDEWEKVVAPVIQAAS